MLESIVHAILRGPIIAFCAAFELIIGIRDVMGKDRLFLTGKYGDPAYRATWQRRDGIFELSMGVLFASYLLPDKYNTVQLIIDIVCLVVMVVHLVMYLSWNHSDKE